MLRAVTRRWAALGLLALLATGAFLPLCDALVYHRAPPVAGANRAHYDPPGGCDSHAEQCVAGPTLNAPRLAASYRPAMPGERVLLYRSPAPYVSTPRSSDLEAPKQPRAPPLPLADLS